MALSCPLGITHCVPQNIALFFRIVDLLLSKLFRSRWPRSVYTCLWTSTPSRSINKKELGQYPGILAEPAWSMTHIYFVLQDRTLRISAHHYKRGGATHLCFTGDSQRLLSTGADGVLACWVWNFTSTGNSPVLEFITSL